MIDLHCHLLPGLDDGAPDLTVSLEMARIAVADGIQVVVCTPHILPTVYNNTGSGIRSAVAHLQKSLSQAGIPLSLCAGADVHIAPDLIEGLGSGRVLTLNDSRYLLLEPPHHTMPPRFEDSVFGLITRGYIPLLTHPERLAWVERHYSVIKRLASSGTLMQITAGSLTGRFGRAARLWANRMLDEGLVHFIASDAHDRSHRPPRLNEARKFVADRLGEGEAEKIFAIRPRMVLENADPSQLLIETRHDNTAPRRFWRLAADIFVGGSSRSDGH